MNVETTQISGSVFLNCFTELTVRGGRQATAVVWLRVLEVISVVFTSPPSKNEVSTSNFPTQCYLDVHKAALYIWIIQIIADNSEGHVCVSV